MRAMRNYRQAADDTYEKPGKAQRLALDSSFMPEQLEQRKARALTLAALLKLASLLKNYDQPRLRVRNASVTTPSEPRPMKA